MLWVVENLQEELFRAQEYRLQAEKRQHQHRATISSLQVSSLAYCPVFAYTHTLSRLDVVSAMLCTTPGAHILSAGQLICLLPCLGYTDTDYIASVCALSHPTTRGCALMGCLPCPFRSSHPLHSKECEGIMQRKRPKSSFCKCCF